MEGRDVFVGGRGSDTMVGGADTDTFKFNASDLVTVPHPIFYGQTYQTVEMDRILDFNAPQGDRIDLMSLLDEATNFYGGSAQDAVSQGYLYWVQHGNPGEEGYGTTIYLDRNGFGADSAVGDIAVVDLAGVGADQIGAQQFIGYIEPTRQINFDNLNFF
jgi:Ca2+-binding RTX toxin-like protein